ncbi:MAG: peptide ABC transporter substrate-binding protein, partial [Mesorhizobium sp.]
MSKNYRTLDQIRRNHSPLENHLVDGLVDGRVSRRDFIRHGSLLGLSLPLLSGIATVAGFSGMPSL